MTEPAERRKPIAIVGMGCRFAGGVTSPDKLWNVIEQGQSGWSEIPKTRFNRDGIYHPSGERIGSVSTFPFEMQMCYRSQV